METMQQIRRAYRAAQAADRKVVSLAQFARDNGVHDIVKAAHKAAQMPRSQATKDRTVAASRANREARGKRSGGGKKTTPDATVKAAKR